MNKLLLKGNDAIIYGALLGGASHFFGYPITPASEIAHTASSHFPRAGRFFLQAESELAAINMIYGAAATGARAMTGSSGPGISLMQEGLSYLAGAELPGVVVDVQRAGPGLGNIWPEQGDYNAVVKGGGHGNYKNIVFAPNSVQEMCDFTYRAFELADRYRMVAFILADAYIGQMMEPIVLPAKVKHGERREWALYADAESRRNCITSIYMNQQIMSAQNIKFVEKYRELESTSVDFEEVEVSGADVVLVAFGICSRICFSALHHLRSKGLKVGLFRPKTLFPFPAKRLASLAGSVEKLIVVELNNGQMADDVAIAVSGKCPVLRYNWFGGIVPSTETIIEKVVHDMSGGAND
jgi:2-oxoisovalerate ferredoxin oxidoreductase alpha subunit